MARSGRVAGRDRLEPLGFRPRPNGERQLLGPLAQLEGEVKHLLLVRLFFAIPPARHARNHAETMQAPSIGRDRAIKVA